MNRVKTLVVVITEKQHTFEALSEVTSVVNQILRVKDREELML